MDTVIKKIIEFGQCNENIEGIILTSSRVNPESKIDFLSDFDIEVYVRDLKLFDNDEWLSFFGVPMAKWPEYPKTNDLWITRLVLFEDKTRIDFQITSSIPVKSKYLNGYEVLVDKRNLFDNLDEVTYKQYALQEPTEEVFLSLTKEFYWDLYYIYKYLYRKDLGFSKYMIDTVIRNEYLNVMLDFYLASKQGFDIEVKRFGLDYKKYLTTEEYSWYLNTFSNLSFANILKSARSLVQLFSTIGKKLGNKLGYKYPQKTHDLVLSFCEEIMEKYDRENGHKELSDMTLAELWEIFPIKVEVYRDEYPSIYEDEALRIKKTLGTKIFRMNHFGSTAIPGLISKPTVDILCELYEGVSFDEVVQRLSSLGYIVSSKQTDPFYRFVLNKGYTKYGYEDKVFHLHLRYPNDWKELYFRDYLLANQEVRNAYGEIKTKLATEHSFHRDNYTQAKGEFIEKHTNIALNEFKHKYNVEKNR
jgi:GrpB-like predicted nucleotidyltransferase (UPF0157 family)